jgi:hypothetical protein
MKRLALAAAIAAAPLAAVAQTGAYDTARLHEHIAVLASDRHEGRGPATPAEALSVDYIVAQMKGAGLEPGGANGSWTQMVVLNRFTVAPGASATLKVGDWTRPLANGPDVTLQSRRGQPRVTLANAPLVFVGYGVKAPERGWDDFKGVDLKGKVALVLVNDPRLRGRATGRLRRQGDDLLWPLDIQVRGAGAAGRGGRHRHPRDGAGGLRVGTVENSWTVPQFDIVLADPAKERASLEGWLQQPIAEELFRRAGLSFADAKARARTKAFRPIPLRGATLSTDFAVTTERTETANVWAS